MTDFDDRTSMLLRPIADWSKNIMLRHVTFKTIVYFFRYFQILSRDAGLLLQNFTCCGENNGKTNAKENDDDQN